MTVRVTLAPSVPREAFEDLAHRSGWTLYAVIEEGDEQPYEEIWAIDGAASAVHYIEDWRLSVAYCLVMGEHESTIASELVENIATVDAHEAARWATSATDAVERARAAPYLAATAPPRADAAILAAFAHLLADPAPEVRYAAVSAASHLAWPELVNLLKPVATGDRDQDVRATAAAALDALCRALDNDEHS